MTGERPLSPVSLASLVRSRTVAALGTLHAGAPFVSMVPFAVLPEGDAFVIHVSRLAAHTRDMIDDPRVSLLVMQPEGDRKSTRLNSSHSRASRMPSSA